MMSSGLYIHIPVCQTKCSYCDFYSVTRSETETVDRFLHCLSLELKCFPSSFSPETVFVGGGTPTVLSERQLGILLERLTDSIDLSRVVEFSVEANPGTLTPGKLNVLKDGGVTRMSLGIQSFNKHALKLLGRIHSVAEAVSGVRMIREAGFERMNIDLIQSIPGMKPHELIQDTRRAISLAPDHISYYNLIYETGTPIARDRDAGRLLLPSDDEEADNYYTVKELLEDAGYEQYEISNFSKLGEECQHNLLYWRGQDYLGGGPSACSHWDGVRFCNVRDLEAYCEKLEAGTHPVDEQERLAPEEKARETLVMQLRLLEGISFDAFEQQTGFSVDELCGDRLDMLIEENLLVRTADHLFLAPDALFISNAVFSELV